MKICFVHMFEIREPEHLEFLGNILVRTKEVLEDEAEIHFLYYGLQESPYLIKKGIRLHLHKLSKNTLAEKLSVLLLVPSHIRRVSRKEEIDIVINLSDQYSFFLIYLGAKLAGCKCIARIVGINPQSKCLPLRRRILKHVGRFCERISLSLADHVLCLSDSLKDLLVNRGNKAGKITVISQGVSMEVFSQRKIMEIKKKPSRLLFVGRIVESKGVVDCIKAYLRLKKSYPNLMLSICGEGPDKVPLSKKYKAERDIFFKGFIPREQLVDDYLSSDIIVLPSYSEGMPNVVLEAMACRLPVVATRTGEIPQLLDGGRGALIMPGDLEGLVFELRRMIEDDKFRLGCAMASHDYVVAKHSYEAVRSATLALFNSCL